jgi:restriction system protein
MKAKNQTPKGDKSVLSASATDGMLNMSECSMADVERLCAGAYRTRGFEVTPSGTDWLLTKGSQRLLLQCKHWKNRKVSEMPVRELYGTMAAHSATGGVLISAGSFTLEAVRFAGFAGIELLDGSKFMSLLQRRAEETGVVPAARSMAG